MFYTQKLKDYFPIITPAFPAMNSTFNVSLTTRNIILTELEKAGKITGHLISSKNTGDKKITWHRLFKKFPFFKAYTNFVQIMILSNNEEINQKWKGYAETKIKKLLQGLENSNEKEFRIMEFRPWPKSYNLGQQETGY